MPEERTVSEISVQTTPDKVTYTRGEELDLTGGVLLITYSDGNITTIDMTDSEVTTSGYDPQTDGLQTVTVYYSNKSTTFAVTVQVYAWKLVGRTLTMSDILEEMHRRDRITNGIED